MSLKPKHHIITILFLTAALLFATSCTSNPKEYQEVTLNDLQPIDDQQKNDDDGQFLRVAISSMTSPKESTVYYSALLKYLEKEVGMPIKVVQRKTYQEVNDLLKKGEIDLAFICTYAYVLGVEEFNLKPFLTPQIEGKNTYRSYIIVDSSSDIYSFEELKNKRFAFTDPLSNTGYIYPTFLVQKFGYMPKDFFNSVTFTYSHDNSITAVAHNVVDGAAVDSLVFDHTIENDPSFIEKVKIINTSVEFGMPPVVVRPDLDLELASNLKRILLTMHTDIEGQRILEHLRIDEFVVQEDKDYDSLRDMVEEVLSEQK